MTIMNRTQFLFPREFIVTGSENCGEDERGFSGEPCGHAGISETLQGIMTILSWFSNEHKRIEAILFVIKSNTRRISRQKEGQA
jgi:hypothetical protein